MVGPSKILTVSYGTFSCTLEGFDDPFSTMRGIAEYFRDLAADDRYFGAEPPIPDAEMLHRIAEADAQKRVVSNVDDNGVTLRQVDEAPVAPPISDVVSAPEAKIPAPFVDEPADLVALNEPSQVSAESVAAKLARIRAVVSNDNVATDLNESETDEDFASSSISDAFDDIEDNDNNAPEPENDTEDQASFEADAEVEAQAETDAEVEAKVEAEVSSEDDTSLETAGQVDVEEPIEQDNESIDALAETDDFEAEQDEPELVLETAEEDSDPVDQDTSADDNDKSSLDAVAEFMGTSTDGDEEDAEPDTEDSEPADVSDQSTISRIIRMRREDFDAATEDQDQENSESDTDVETPIEAVTVDETPENNDIDSEQEENSESSLSAEDEAELMANLAEVQRKAEAEQRAEKEGRALLENQDIESSAESVSRILDVTNTEMEETEGTRRRSAIAHLKAAVVATRADKLLSRKRKEDDADELNQYRDDLAKVVKPRRPADSGRTARQAPLMLVSEQRVDEPEVEVNADAGSVLPRRVSTDIQASDNTHASDTSESDRDNMFLENNTFAEFAEEMGAHDLPDLLEAAAAYAAYVEGHAHFSRPQIMQAVAAIKEEEFTREEGLRSFGMLLRRGKIKKLKRGQFTVADTTRFHPQQHAVGE